MTQRWEESRLLKLMPTDAQLSHFDALEVAVMV
jgi:hypothetical protein